jgi:hypothetical protein
MTLVSLAIKKLRTMAIKKKKKKKKTAALKTAGNANDKV